MIELPPHHTRIGHALLDRVYPVFVDKASGKHVFYRVDPVVKDDNSVEDEVMCCDAPPIPEGDDWWSDGRKVSGGCPATAVHEAGHAVACHLSGIEVEYVTIIPFERRRELVLGWCQYDYRLMERLEKEPKTWGPRHARATLGGPEAEAIHYERATLPVPADRKPGWGRDTAEAGQFLPDADKVLPELRVEVRNRLLKPEIWQTVVALKDRLLTVGAIGGKRLRQILQQATG